MFSYTPLLLLSLLVAASCETIIEIRPSDNQSLEYYLCSNSSQLESDTVLLLTSDRYTIGSGDPCVISDLTNLTIRGNDATAELACTDGFFGRIFAFINVTNLRFENLVVTTCGAFIPESLAEFVNESAIAHFGKNQKAVFLFAQVTNLEMQYVVVSRSYGFGMAGVNLQGDTVFRQVAVVSTDYREHPLCFGTETDLSCTGSGIFLLYSDPAENSTFQTASNTTLTINSCAFSHNTYIIPPAHYLQVYTIARSPFRTEELTVLGGSGITLYSGQRAYYLDTQITNSSFSFNRAQASPLVIAPYNNIRESSYLVENCKFFNNEANFPGRGGGMVLLIIVFVDSLSSFPTYPIDNIHKMLVVRETEFTDNKAYIGGGAYLHITPQNVTDYQIHLDNVSFVRNSAQVGSALSVNSIPTLFIQRSSEVLLEDVMVINNTFPSNLRTTTLTIDNSAAFVFTIINNVTIAGRNTTGGSLFQHNSPGAVLVSGGKLYLRGHIEFSDNLSFRGGAIALFDYTLLHIYEGARINFVRNHALSTGGAIFANSLGTGVLDVCVFQIIGGHRISTAAEVGLLDLHLKFESNRADVAGNSIYASPLYNCAFSSEASTVQNTFDYNEQDIYRAVFQFVQTVQNGNEEITSTPDRISFCNQTANGFIEFTIFDKSVTTVPGKQISLGLIPLDPILTPVQSVMFAELSNQTSHSLGPTQSIQTHNGTNCSTINFNIYGAEGTSVEMYLYARLGGTGLAVMVNVEDCPPGFELALQDNLEQCTCSRYVIDIIQTTCNISTYTVARPGSVWMGSIESTQSRVKWVSTCPIGYCNQVRDVDLQINDTLCDTGRTGVLCGKCKEGLSIVFGTPVCLECSSFWLFTIILYAVAGIVIVFLLFILNLTVAKGTMNGLIFYVNIVSVNGGIFFEGNASFVRVFISLLNLELGFPICFFHGMDEAAKIGLQYVFPVYLLLLCLFLIFLTRWSSKVQKLTACNGITVLATLFYLSYAKLLRTVIDCLSFATLNSEAGYETIWLFDGNLRFFNGIHILLVIVSLVVAIGFLIPYTLPLVFIKQVDRHSIKLKPLFDAYAGPYKDRYRYWFGLRIVLLIAVCITYAIAGADYQSLALTVESLFILVFTVCQAYARPYKNKYVGLLDLFFLLNFLFMAIWLLHLFDVNILFLDMPKKIIGVAIMVGLAFVVALGILVYHILSQIYQNVPRVREKVDKAWENSFSHGWYQTYKNMKHTMANKRTDAYNPEATEMKSGGDTTVTRSEVVIENESITGTAEMNVRKETFSQLREPVLEYSH